SGTLNDDRIGRALDTLFAADVPSLVLSVMTHVVREFQVSLDELHNDSTTISFHGDYTEASTAQRVFGRQTVAITHGHSKDHRPDLKQLLFILTVTADGGVPLAFRAESGNVVDDQTHRETWDLLCQLTGRRDFLYVADCKLATSENMASIHQRPRTERGGGGDRRGAELLLPGSRDLDHDDGLALVASIFVPSSRGSVRCTGCRRTWHDATRLSRPSPPVMATSRTSVFRDARREGGSPSLCIG
ncbi:MAG: IS1634 family transposase, partial [Planctomycetes bacterium]|nr:IS1634 family transposase [Planctomycetota bacterium]